MTIPTPDDVRTVGFIGAGHIGGTVARLFVRTGRSVVLSNSRGPESLADLVDEIGETARAVSPAEAAAAGDVVVVAVPLRAYRDVPVDPLAGKVVVDTTNYYPQRDGQIPELDDESLTTGELLQLHLPTSHVVKAFNAITAGDLATRAQSQGSVGRRAIPIAGDDRDAKDLVTSLVDQLGFDVVDAGPLAECWRFQRDEPAYIIPADRQELTERLARATRYRDMTPEERERIRREQQAARAAG
jgi:predicted dinucleotide-binding enzyme